MKPFCSTSLSAWPVVGVLWKNRELLWHLTRRQIAIRHKGSYLGFLWVILQPLLALGMYVLVFGVIMGGKFHVSNSETSLDFALGIFLGLTIYNLIAEAFGAAPSIVLSNPNYVKKIVFPLEILPAAVVGASLYHGLVALGLCLLGLLFWGPAVGWGMLWIPVIILPVLAASLGIAWILASLGVYFRDLGPLTGFVAMALFYASAIFYSTHRIPPEAWMFLKWNPFLHAIDLSRDAVLWGEPMRLRPLLYLYAWGGGLAVGGEWLFRRLKGGFADVL